MTTTDAHPTLSALARPSGGLAMLAIDQREALREMMAAQRAPDAPAVTDAEVTEFKLTAARILTPHASAVLLDRQFVLDAAIEQSAVATGCGLIAAGDLFVPGEHEHVTDAVIDPDVDPAHYAAHGAVAMKLLVICRPDEPAGPRVEMVQRFAERCRAANLLSIIEPLSKAPRDGREWDWDAGVLAAAHELGGLGIDLYKAEVPLHGLGSDTELAERCAEITAAVAVPWVVLSSGVADEDFPRAVELAMGAGATGFLAGRAVWRACLGAPDVPASLAADGVARLDELSAIVDRASRDRISQ